MATPPKNRPPYEMDAARYAQYVQGAAPEPAPVLGVVCRIPVGSPETDRVRAHAIIVAEDGRGGDVVAVVDDHTWLVWIRDYAPPTFPTLLAERIHGWGRRSDLDIQCAVFEEPAGTPWAAIHERAMAAIQAEAGKAHQSKKGRRRRADRLEYEARRKAVLEGTDLPGFIGQRVALKRRGRVWVGLCPFHNEGHPSFYVYRDHYHCYGCNQHGNVFDWCRDQEGWDFKRAMEELEHNPPPRMVDLAPSTPSDEWGGREPVPTWAGVYADLWPLLALSDTHRAALRARGLTDEQIDAHGFRSMPEERTGWETRLPHPDAPQRDLRGVPGFSQYRGGYLHGPRGILIPVRNLEGQIIGAQIRVDEGRGGSRYVWWSTPSDRTDDQGRILYPGGASVGSLATLAMPMATPCDPATYGGEVLITEGVLKAIITAEYFAAVPVIGLPGLSRPGNALRLLQILNPHRITLALDADSAGQGEAPNLAAHLAQEFYETWLADGLLLAVWPEGPKGIDDAIAAGMSPDLISIGERWPALRPPQDHKE